MVPVTGGKPHAAPSQHDSKHAFSVYPRCYPRSERLSADGSITTYQPLYYLTEREARAANL
ncbi:hypothetical protein X975_18091, partial [Stegodyphus mimosarum]